MGKVMAERNTINSSNVKQTGTGERIKHGLKCDNNRTMLLRDCNNLSNGKERKE